MNHFRYLIPIILFLGSCQSGEKSQTATDSVSASPAQEELPPDDITPVASFPVPEFEQPWDALLVPYASVMTDTLETDLLFTNETFTPVSLISTSTLRVPPDGDLCSQYYWHEVKLPSQNYGFVKGNYVLKDWSNEEYNNYEFQLNGKSYTLYFLTDAGIGPSDENGLTGCNQYIIPYFYDPEEKLIHFVEGGFAEGQKYWIDTFQDWLSFVSSEGGSASITGMEVTDNKITVKIGVSYQDGGASIAMTILFEDDRFLPSGITVLDEVQPEGN